MTTFGIVEKVFIEKNNQGNIWIKFSDTATAMKAQENLNSQYFDNRKIFCYFVTEETWNKRVSIWCSFHYDVNNPNSIDKDNLKELI